MCSLDMLGSVNHKGTTCKQAEDFLRLRSEDAHFFVLQRDVREQV